LTTTRANAQLVCWFTAIWPHLPDFGTPEDAGRRRLECGDTRGALVLVAGEAAAGELEAGLPD
jgi:hypothetical protein